ncbi:MAG: DUF4845 domain-containing protein [Gammaproteobacteria bacterium]|nr:DUF4845 domain-containing protein [Gammaproteobacteria bacterium]
MKQLIKQRGFSMLSGLIILSILAFALNCAFKLVPLYIDNITVRSALKSLAKDPELPDMKKSDIRHKLSNYFHVNNVRGKPSESISIESTPKTKFVNINYEERTNIIFNIDAVVVFENQLDINNPDLCCDPR